MSIEVYDRIPQGVDALERKITDRSLPRDVREQIWKAASDLARPKTQFPGPRNSRQGWEELLEPALLADVTISATASETIMQPDITLPANYLTVGKALKYTLLFDVSTVITTPGTLTYRLRYGGVAGTLLATSGAFAPDSAAASTTTSMMIEWWLVVRATGTSGSVFVMGRLTMTDTTPTKAQLDMLMIPPSAPAAVTVNTTTANALSPTSQASVTTGSHRTHMAFLEAMN